MRLLIYGFGPYDKFQQNVTENILVRLPKRRTLRKVVFSVRFHKNQFLNAIKNYKPDVILGLGQCSRGRLLRIETRAANKMWKDKRESTKPILAGGAGRLFTNLKLKAGREARSSNDAGSFVCNYSMYVMLDYLKRRRLNVPFGFIHIPHRYDPRKAVGVLVKLIGEIEDQPG